MCCWIAKTLRSCYNADMETMQCIQCGQVKSIDEFTKLSLKFARPKTCKECIRDNNRPIVPLVTNRRSYPVTKLGTAAVSQLYRTKPSDYTCRASILCRNKAKHFHHHLGYDCEHIVDVIPVCPSCHTRLHKIGVERLLDHKESELKRYNQFGRKAF